MTKNEIIQQAYGIHWDAVKDYVDADGWCDYHKVKMHPSKILKEWDSNGQDMFRPKSLQGIENNHGWLPIPRSGIIPEVDVWIININGNKIPFYHDAIEAIPEGITHYQIIQQPPSPIY